MKILITGVAGLIGSNFARWLFEHTEHKVHGVDNLSCGLRSNIPWSLSWDNITLGCGSNQFESMMHTFQPDVVYHFAAYAAECLSPFVRRFNYLNNLVATAEVVNACLNCGTKRLVFTSSMATYGRGAPPFDEADPCWPIDPYGVAKLACERDIQIAGEQHGLEWCIIRPHNVYGPGQICTQKYRNVFGIWMNRFQHKETLRIYGDGNQMRAFSYIEDILPCLLEAGTCPEAAGQIINLGGCKPVRINDAAAILCRVLGPGAKIEHCDARHEVQFAWSTTEKSTRILGYQDRTILDSGLRHMWTWAKDLVHDIPSLPHLEVERGLPIYWRPAPSVV